MKKVDPGQAATILANLGVIAGILFLGLELRQNNSLLTAQARYSLRQLRADTADAISSLDVLEATHKYAAGEEVTPAERSSALMTALKIIELWEWQYGEYAEGALRRDELPIGAWQVWYYSEGEIPVPIQEVWEARRDVLNPGFVQFYEENVIDR